MNFAKSADKNEYRIKFIEFFRIQVYLSTSLKNRKLAIVLNTDRTHSTNPKTRSYEQVSFESTQHKNEQTIVPMIATASASMC